MRQTFRQWSAQIARRIVVAARPPREKRPQAKPDRWRLVVPGYGTCETKAHTAGEARALVRDHLGIPRSQRLPAGTTVERISVEKDAA
jgi:hypothetical protein